MKSNKVTKKQLLLAILCDKKKWKILVNKHWPQRRRKMSVVEIVHIGMEKTKTKPNDYLWIIERLDHPRMITINPEHPYYHARDRLTFEEKWEAIKRYVGDENV